MNVHKAVAFLASAITLASQPKIVNQLIKQAQFEVKLVNQLIK